MDTSISFSVLVGSLPIILHLFDKGMEFASPISSKVVQAEMARDNRVAVNAIGGNDAAFLGVQTYFEFKSKVHFIIALNISSIFSAYIGQLPCSLGFLTFHPAALTLILIIGCSLIGLLLAIINRKFDLADETAANRWRWLAIILFVAVIGMDFYFHFDCHEVHASAP